MPRLARGLLRKAWSVHRFLPSLLRPCRDLDSAQNELRWLQEHAHEQSQKTRLQYDKLLGRLCMQRSRGVPLQYVLGTQPFGSLEIRCRRGVLIPRADTEGYVTNLADQLQQPMSEEWRGFFELKTLPRVRVLDLCTGTGCIALLLYHLLRSSFPSVQTLGVDVSFHAIRLATENLKHNVRLGSLHPEALDDVKFVQGDVLRDDSLGTEGWDVVVSNPPYISETSFYKHTEASVRHFEPRLALVPVARQNSLKETGVDLTGDIFYDKLTAIGERAKAKLLVMEVEDRSQAERILRKVTAVPRFGYWRPHALWCDDVMWSNEPRLEAIDGVGDILVEGNDKVRAVVLARRINETPER